MHTRESLLTNKIKMDGKTVIVTGANNGIGKETARELARRGARVILACRNLKTGKQARTEIINTTNNENVILKKIDLSSFQSIRDFAEEINKTEPKLHVLIHNAGIVSSQNATSEDGLELTMATNHFGPFLLTHLLIDLLKKSKPSRIIVVSSVTHHFWIPKFSDLQDIYTIYSLIPQVNYFKTKFANVSFTRELARRLEGTNVTANSLHPGLIDTEIWNRVPIPFNWLIKIFSKFIFKSCAEGSQTTVYLATSDEVANVSGKYFVDCKKAYMSKWAYDPGWARKFWEISEKNIKLSETDPRI